MAEQLVTAHCGLRAASLLATECGLPAASLPEVLFREILERTGAAGSDETLAALRNWSCHSKKIKGAVF